MIRVVNFLLGFGACAWLFALWYKSLFYILSYWAIFIPWVLCLMLYLSFRYASKHNLGEKAKRKPRVKKYV